MIYILCSIHSYPKYIPFFTHLQKKNPVLQIQILFDQQQYHRLPKKNNTFIFMDKHFYPSKIPPNHYLWDLFGEYEESSIHSNQFQNHCSSSLYIPCFFENHPLFRIQKEIEMIDILIIHDGIFDDKLNEPGTIKYNYMNDWKEKRYCLLYPAKKVIFFIHQSYFHEYIYYYYLSIQSTIEWNSSFPIQLFHHIPIYDFSSFQNQQEMISYIEDSILQSLFPELLLPIQKEKESFGFFMIRHVDSYETNQLWIECYRSIRKFYQHKIIIIDDHSHEEFLSELSDELINTVIIQSSYHGRGELLPYYFYYQYPLFEKAVILHDSVFIQKYIDFESMTDECRFLWHFEHHWDHEKEELNLLREMEYDDEYDILHLLFEEDTIIEKYQKKDWYGCFGMQTYIQYDFLKKVEEKYHLFRLLPLLQTRENRMNAERIIGFFFTQENPQLLHKPSFYGIIHHYIHWGYSYQNYIHDKDDPKNRYKDCDIMKVWSGR